MAMNLKTVSFFGSGGVDEGNFDVMQRHNHIRILLDIFIRGSDVFRFFTLQ